MATTARVTRAHPRRCRWVNPFCLGVLGLVWGVPSAWAATTRYLNSSGGDDTSPINAAITSSSAGDTVYLNPGTFRISGAIQAKTGVAIVGGGRGSTTVLRTGGAGTPLVNLGGVSNVAIASLTLDGAGAAQGINAWSGSGHYIHDATIRNLGANAIGVYFSSAVTDSRIMGNQITNIGVGSEWGAGVRMAWGSSRNQVVGNTVSNAGRGGIFGNDGSTDLFISGNTVSGSGSGGTGLGIEVWNGCHRALIQGNVVDQWLSVDNSSLVAVRNNRVNGGYCGLEMASGGHDNVFSNNAVTGAALGISVSGANSVKERVLWANNTIQSSTSWGTQIMSESATGAVRRMYFARNTFQGSAGAGFRFHPNYPNGSIQCVTLEGNTITGNQYGITGGDWSPGPCLDKLSIDYNTIANNTLAAFSGSMGTPLGDAYYGNDLRWTGNSVWGNGTNNQQASKGTFFPGKVPSVSIALPGSITAGQAAHFSLSYSGSDPLANVLWDLGVGLPATGSTASVTYAVAGTYPVELVVWDSLGRAAHATTSIEVLAPSIWTEWLGTSGDWANSANWSAGVPNGTNAMARFASAGDGTQAINAASAITLGTLELNSPVRHLLTGSGSLNLAVSTGTGAMSVLRGDHRINLPLSISCNATLSIASQATLTLGGAMTIKAGKTVNKSGSLLLTAPVTIEAGGRLVLNSGPTRLFGSPVLGSGAAIDVMETALVADYSAQGSPAAAIAAQLLRGYAGGAWNGAGINTSRAVVGRTGLGWSDDAAGRTVLIRFTYCGDADLNGKVDVADLGRLATSWQRTGVWAHGDFDYSGTINVADLGILAANWQAGATASPGPGLAEMLASLGLGMAIVPEPALAAAMPVMLFLSGRRLRSR